MSFPAKLFEIKNIYPNTKIPIVISLLKNILNFNLIHLFLGIIGKTVKNYESVENKSTF